MGGRKIDFDVWLSTDHPAQAVKSNNIAIRATATTAGTSPGSPITVGSQKVILTGSNTTSCQFVSSNNVYNSAGETDWPIDAGSACQRTLILTEMITSNGVTKSYDFFVCILVRSVMSGLDLVAMTVELIAELYPTGATPPPVGPEATESARTSSKSSK